MHKQHKLTISDPTVTTLVKRLTDNQREMLGIIIEICEEKQQQIWFVGGIIRDYFEDRVPTDIDLATDGDALALATELINRVDIAEINLSFNSTLFACSISVANVRLFDINSMRHETYLEPGKLPKVETTDSINIDLERRDFTVNSMALGLTTDVRDVFLDPLNGKVDIRNRVIRVLHEDSLLDDPSRIFRAARYCTSHGYSISPQIENSLSETNLDPIFITQARLHTELLLTSQSTSWFETLLLLDKWGIWQRLGLRNVTNHLTACKQLSVEELDLEEMIVLLTLNEATRNRQKFLSKVELSKASRKLISGSVDIFYLHNDVLTQERLDRLSTYPDLWYNLIEKLQDICLVDLRHSVNEWLNCDEFLSANELNQLGVLSGPDLNRMLAILKWAKFTKTIGSKEEARSLVKRMVTSR